MKEKNAGLAALLVTAATAALACAMRAVTMRRALDENGLLLSGNRLPLIMAVFVVLALALTALLLHSLQKRPECARNFSTHPAWLTPPAVAAVLIAVSGALALKGTAGFERTVAVLGILGGILLLVQTLWQLRGGKLNFVLLFVPCLWLIFRLIFDYRIWSQDPVLLDYCYLLLADITGMLSAYHIAGFSFDKGKRRMTAFWCAAAVVFSAVSLYDCLRSRDTAEAVHFAAMLLWLGAALVQLCRSRPDAPSALEQTPPEPQQTA